MNEIEKLESGIEYRSSDDIVADARNIIDSAQRSAHQAVNVALVVRNWLLGRRIAEEELGDGARPELYDRKVVHELAEELIKEYGRGCTTRSLYQYVWFYRIFWRLSTHRVHNLEIASLASSAHPAPPQQLSRLPQKAVLLDLSAHAQSNPTALGGAI